MKPFFKLSLFFLLFVGFTIPACKDDIGVDCNCPDIEGAYFDIDEVELKNIRIKENGFIEQVHNPAIEVDWDQYILNGEFGVSFFGYNDTSPKFDFSLIPSAYGCSCLGSGYNGSMEKFSEFKVITRNDFDDEHLANDTINALIDISVFGNDPIDLGEFLERDTSNIQFLRFDLTLKSAPTLSNDFDVDLLIRLNNGDEILSSNGSVKLK